MIKKKTKGYDGTRRILLATTIMMIMAFCPPTLGSKLLLTTDTAYFIILLQLFIENINLFNINTHKIVLTA